MICNNCKENITSDDIYCLNCGEKNNNMNTKKPDIVDDISSKIQETVGSTVSMAQSGLEKVKSKAEILKEKGRLSNVSSDAQSKKAKLLADLGLLTYEKIRLGMITDEELIELSKGIVGFDYIIYDSNTKIMKLDKLNEAVKCECSAEISQDNKFCPGCGKKVEKQIDNTVYINCNHCDAIIDEKSIFCPCCGNKIKNYE